MEVAVQIMVAWAALDNKVGGSAAGAKKRGWDVT